MIKENIKRWLFLSIMVLGLGTGCMAKNQPEDPRFEPMFPDTPQPLPPLMSG